MHFLSFAENKVEEGAPLSVVASWLSSQGSKSLDGIQSVPLYWPENAPQGRIEVFISPNTLPQSGSFTRPGDVYELPFGAFIRIFSEDPNIQGVSLKISDNGTVAQVSGTENFPQTMDFILEDGVFEGPLTTKAQVWLSIGDTGLSSRVLCRHLLGVYQNNDGSDTPHHPRDASDFVRCVKFFNAIPEARPFLPRMRHQSPEWSVLADNWEHLKNFLEGDRENFTIALKDVLSNSNKEHATSPPPRF